MTNVYRASWFVPSSHPRASCFQWRRLQRLVVPQERYGERSEPALKRKRLSQPRKESEPLTRRSPSIVSRSGSVSSLSFAVRRFLLRGVHFHSPTLSSALSNPETIVGTSQETQESWKKTPPLNAHKARK